MSQQKFINRKKELNFLNKRYDSRDTEVIIIYGRRRVGKTEAIIEFIKGKPAIYFLATKDTENENLKSLKTKMSELIKNNTFDELIPSSWVNLFELFIKFADDQRKIVICIDEFPYLTEINKAIPSIFQKICDTVIKGKNIMIILSGSSVSHMESQVLYKSSPMYGRRTGQWNMEPMHISELNNFLPNYSFEDLIKTWACLGGIPAYLLKFQKDKSFFDNIFDNILSKGTFLYEEIDFLLEEEFRESRNYKVILKAISQGNRNLSSICNTTGLDKSMVSKYLDVLKKTYIVFDENPVTSPAKSKSSLYYITDPFFNFWFKYCHTNFVNLEAGRSDLVLKNIIKDYSNYMGEMFERVVKNLIREKIILEKFDFNKIDRWWHKENEIDIVALNDNKKEILFAECKWSSKKVDVDLYLQLKEKAKLVRWHNDKRKERFALFSKKGFTSKMVELAKKEKVLLFDLKSIEKILG